VRTKARVNRIGGHLEFPKAIVISRSDERLLRYTIYAKQFGWTPQQVDALTIEQDLYLIPILEEILGIEAKKRQG
jgi:hypothetical protein